MQLVDTSVWIHALRRPGNPKIQELLKPLVISGSAAITEWIVLELMVGIRTSENANDLIRKMTPLPRLSFSSEKWNQAWTLAAGLRKKGVSPGAADCFISTIAITHNVPLVHCDADFEQVAKHSDLRTIDWTIYANP